MSGMPCCCGDNGWIDLHIHSTASDGTLNPQEIIEMARGLKLRAISITDHDTIEGAKEALLHDHQGLELLSGVEISVSFNSRTLHILGYFIDLENKALSKALSDFQKARRERNPKIIQKLQDLGIDITYEEVQKKAGQGQLGRPHIAETLVTKGVVRSMEEAFDKYLGSHAPAYVDKYRLYAGDAIRLIKEASGIPVLAHPGVIKTDSEQESDSIIGSLAAQGLQGLEIYYTDHSGQQIAVYERIAEKYKLLATGGTDFHGARKANTRMGVGKGNLRIPYSLVAELKKMHNALYLRLL